MPMPQDWLPPYPPGDERNDVHRKAFEQARATQAAWTWRQCTDYADDVLAGWLLAAHPLPSATPARSVAE